MPRWPVAYQAGQLSATAHKPTLLIIQPLRGESITVEIGLHTGKWKDSGISGTRHHSPLLSLPSSLSPPPPAPTIAWRYLPPEFLPHRDCCHDSSHSLIRLSCLAKTPYSSTPCPNPSSAAAHKPGLSLPPPADCNATLQPVELETRDDRRYMSTIPRVS